MTTDHQPVVARFVAQRGAALDGLRHNPPSRGGFVAQPNRSLAVLVAHLWRNGAGPQPIGPIVERILKRAERNRA